MRCDDCGSPANIRYVEMVDGELRDLHLCDDCANTRGMALSLSPFAGPLVDMLMGLLDEMRVGEERTEDGRVCPECGLTRGEFRRTGKLGCASCYEAFGSELKPLLRRVHGSTVHTGTIPSKAPRDIETGRRARALQLELERAVRAEEYERAAELRDEIRRLETEVEVGDTEDRTPVESDAGGANVDV